MVSIGLLTITAPSSYNVGCDLEESLPSVIRLLNIRIVDEMVRRQRFNWHVKS